MRYSDIIGQEEAAGRLKRMVNDNRVPHALLFSGSEGYGTLPAAVAFAQHLFCAAPTADGPCDQCQQCRRVSSLVHPDVHLVFPIALSKNMRTSDDGIAMFREKFAEQPYMTLNDWFAYLEADNKQPHIGVEESAAIMRKLSYTSFEGRYRVMIIWHADVVRDQAANKLLKILEEPSARTIFILITARPDQLLATILSRVQQVKFRRSDDASIAEALKKRYGLDERAARETAVMADGSYGDALRLLNENEDAVSLLNRFQTFMRIALRFDALKANGWIDEFAKQGREQHKKFFQYALGVFRDCLMYNYGERTLVRLNGEERDFLVKFAAYVHTGNYEKLTEEFNSGYYFIERNANPKILFTDLFLTTNALLNVPAS